MSEYKTSFNSKLSVDLKQGDELIGKLTYAGWFSFNALIEISNGMQYKVEPKGFWGTTIELKSNEQVLLKFNMNWKGEIVLITYFDDIETGYIFKHRGLFKETFVLVDQAGVDLLVMKPHLKWSKLNYEYDITTSGIFDSLHKKEILLIVSLHCANYYMAMMAGAAA